MDKPNRVEEIVKRVWLAGNNYEGGLVSLTEIETISRATLAIKEYYLGLLPKEEDMHYTGEQQHDILRDIRNEYGAGRNSAIQEMRDKIKVSQ
jgi:hypothetical protein